jgi:N-acetylglucosamine malate deacetylase 1
LRLSLTDMKLDILAIGVHPDDVELGCSGTIIKEIQQGRKVGIIDLTQGELGTRGTVETRYAEAAAAAAILGVQVRENLKMRDGFFQHDEAHLRLLIQAIRTYRPSIVLANAPEDRHPDHGRAAKLIQDACFLSGLMRIETVDQSGQVQDRWRPAYVLHYIQDRLLEPDVVIDISSVFEQRMQSIQAYGTQFFNPTDTVEVPQTYISSPAFYEGVIARARMMGKRIGVAYGEGFITEKVPGLSFISDLIQQET